MENNRKHYLAAISAFIIWGFFSIPLRALTDYSAGEILYFRILFSAFVLMVVAILRRDTFSKDLVYLKSLSRSKRNSIIALTLAGGALLCVNWLTFIYIVNNINIKTASFSYLICPVITAALAFFLIKETITRLQWLAVALCTVSCVLIGMSSALELGFSVLTAFTYALYLISQRKNQGFDRLNVLAVQVLFSLAVLSAGFKLLVDEIPTQTSFYGIIGIIAVLFTVLPLFLNLFALNKINSATIGILMYLNPIINFTIAFAVFNEKVTLLQVVGYLILVIALIVFNKSNFAKLKPVMRRG